MRSPSAAFLALRLARELGAASSLEQTAPTVAPLTCRDAFEIFDGYFRRFERVGYVQAPAGSRKTT